MQRFIYIWLCLMELCAYKNKKRFYTLMNSMKLLGQVIRKCVICHMRTTKVKGADQPAHLRSVISTFVVHSLDSMMCILAISKVSRF